MDDREWSDAILYRLAYGLAADRVEADKYDVLDGRRYQDKGGTAAEIVAALARRLGVTGPIARAIVRAAVEDALAGRRPHW